MKIIAERKNKTIYQDGNKIIKLFEQNHPTSDILNEALNQARVSENSNLNIPKLIEIKKINNRWALIYEFIEGETIDELINKYPEKKEEYLNIFVEIQLIILKNEVPMLNRMKEKFTRKLEKTALIDDETKYELQERLHGIKDHDELCHGDYQPSNVIVTKEGKIYVIDWAHATQGNAAADAARTYLLFSMSGKEETAEKYLDLFSSKSEIPKDAIQKWLPIVAATQKTKNIKEEQEFLSKWINVVDYE